jgi:hypothetical protein
MVPMINSDVICYSNSILQVIASCIHMTEFFLSPPSKEHQHFRLYNEFAKVIHSMVTDGPNVVNLYKFVDIFMSYHKCVVANECMYMHVVFHIFVLFYCDIVVLSYWSVMLYIHNVVMLYCDIVVLSYYSVVFYCHIIVLLYCDIAMLSYCSVVLMMFLLLFVMLLSANVLFILLNISECAQIHNGTERMLACRTETSGWDIRHYCFW